MIIYAGERIVPFTGHDPKLRIVCPNCRRAFMLRDGQTIQGACEGEPATGFYCTYKCVLDQVPINAIGSC